MTAIIYAETAAGWFDKDRLTIKRSYGSTRSCAPRRELLYPSFSIPVSPSLAPLYGDPSLNRWDKSDSLAGIKREIWRPIGFLEVVPRYSGDWVLDGSGFPWVAKGFEKRVVKWWDVKMNKVAKCRTDCDLRIIFLEEIGRVKNNERWIGWLKF